MSIAKQQMMFDNSVDETTRKYSGSVTAPVYSPAHAKPPIIVLCDQSKTKSLIAEIDAANIPDDEKDFLRAAAWRHSVFHYESIADFYAHSKPETQRLMERSALVIIDFDSAIERGFVRLCDDIRGQYLEEYSGDAAQTT